MTAQEANLILEAVPFGSEHAIGWRAIYQAVRIDADSTFAIKLRELHREGLIQRRSVPFFNSSKFLYWRERVAKACVPRDLMMAG